MKSYKLKSSAIRAAKKEMGEGWAETSTIELLPDGEYVIELKNPKQAAPTLPSALDKTIAVTQQLADIQADAALKADKKAEIEAKKPKHIPKAPLTSIVASESASSPKPSLPAFLKIAPPADLEVAKEPETDVALSAQQKIADKIANASVVNLDPLKPRVSTTDLPTKKVWHIADEMMDAAKKAGEAAPKRKEVIAECVRRGVAYGTSRTQYQHWFKQLADSAAAPIATIGKDGKITYPGK